MNDILKEHRNVKRVNREGYLRNQPKKSKQVAYCCYSIHKGYMSLKTVKNHKCFEKKCPYLKINHDHPYWSQKSLQKLATKILKKMDKEGYRKVILKGNAFRKPDKKKLIGALKSLNIKSMDEVSFSD